MVVKALQSSPRFYESSQGFNIQVLDGGGGLQVCFMGTNNENLLCVDTPSRSQLVHELNKQGNFVETEVELSDHEYVVEIVDLFHLQVFGLPMGFSGAEWDSLDGSTINSRQRNHEKLKDIIQNR